MRRLLRWCNWEMNNELFACTYFTVMLFMYGIIALILGRTDFNIFIIFEMYLVNYVLSTLQKILLDSEKEYSKKAFLLRTVILSISTVALVSIISHIGGWFKGMPLWAGILIVAMLILSYLTVWVIIALTKKYDTKQLNEQLANFKRMKQN